MVYKFSSSSTESTESQGKSEEEASEGYYYYEAIKLDTDSVRDVYRSVRGDQAKYSIVPLMYHVTTEYRPETTHESLYGTEVTVHISGYSYGDIVDEDGNVLSSNEGLSCEVSSDNEEMQALLDSIDKNWHITGSYTNAAKYTENLDFSNAEKLDVTLKGVFVEANSNDEISDTPGVLLTEE